MAKYRYVYCEFWIDPDMLEATPEDKFFYLYLLTNPHTTQCGIYELSVKQAEFETGYNRDTVTKLIDRFENIYKKIRYNYQTREVAIRNWARYNLTNSPTVKTCIEKELKQVKDTALIGYVYGTNTVSIPPRKEKEKEKEDIVLYQDVVNYLNQKTGKNFKPASKSTQKHIHARWGEGHRLEQFCIVIDNKVAEWLGTTMEKFLRPETLFGVKFEGYLNENPDPPEKPRKFYI